MHAGDPIDLMTAEEAAEFLGKWQPSTMYAAAREGRLPCVRLWTGRRKSALRFSRKALLRHIEEHSVPAKSRTRRGDAT
jgi:hypothetical protein